MRLRDCLKIPFALRSPSGRLEGYERSYGSRCTLRVLLTTNGLLLLSPFIHAFNLFTDYAKLTPEQSIERLQVEQADHPHDPQINYNLGVAQYRAGKFQQAAGNFERTLEHVGDNTILKTQTLFNHGNSRYKNVITQLPPRWEDEKTTIEPQKLEEHIAQIKQAIEDYKKVMTLDGQNQRAETNKKSAEELLKKLEQKKQQQQDKKQDDKKDEKDQQDKQDKQEKQDQQEQKNQKQDGQKDQQKSSEKDKKQNQNDGSKDQGQGKGQERPDKSDGQSPGREDQKLDDDQGKNGEQRDRDHKSPEEQKQKSEPTSERTQEEQEMQQSSATAAAGAEQQQQEDPEMRRMRAVLENLQSEESKTQKRLLHKAVEQKKPSEQQGQKPW